MDWQCERPLDCRPLNPTVTEASSSKNIKLVKFLSHRKYLPTPLAPQHHWHLLQQFTWCMCVCLCVCKVRCVCVCVCARTAVYSRDFSHGYLVYLLYLQYNASVNISNFETQVSISGAAAVCAQPGAEKRWTPPPKRRRSFKAKGWQRGPKIMWNKNGQRERRERGNKRMEEKEKQGRKPEKINCTGQQGRGTGRKG